MSKEILDAVGVMAGPSRWAEKFNQEAQKGYVVIAAFLITGLFAWLVI